MLRCVSILQSRQKNVCDKSLYFPRQNNLIWISAKSSSYYRWGVCLGVRRKCRSEVRNSDPSVQKSIIPLREITLIYRECDLLEGNTLRLIRHKDCCRVCYWWCFFFESKTSTSSAIPHSNTRQRNEKIIQANINTVRISDLHVLMHSFLWAFLRHPSAITLPSCCFIVKSTSVRLIWRHDDSMTPRTCRSMYTTTINMCGNDHTLLVLMIDW